MTKQKRKGWRHGLPADTRDALTYEPNRVKLHAKDFCDHFGLTLEQLKTEHLAGRITVYVMEDRSLALAADEALAWLRRHRAMH